VYLIMHAQCMLDFIIALFQLFIISIALFQFERDQNINNCVLFYFCFVKKLVICKFIHYIKISTQKSHRITYNTIILARPVTLLDFSLYLKGSRRGEKFSYQKLRSTANQKNNCLVQLAKRLGQIGKYF